MDIHNLLDQVKISVIANPVAAGQADNPSAHRVDMLGYDGVLFLFHVEVFAATACATVSVEGGATDADPTATGALTGATCTYTDTVGGVYDNSVLAINVYKPQLRYLATTRIGTVANVTWGPCIAIQYKASQVPVDHTLAVHGILASASVNSV